MVPISRWCSAVVVAAACSSPPAPAPVLAPDDDALVAHDWVVKSHVLTQSTTLSDADADEYHARTLRVSGESYQTPWQGTCEELGRKKQSRILVEVAMELDISKEPRKQLAAYGLGKNLFEFKLTCPGDPRVPPLTLYVAGPHAMTCFAGVCYLLAR